MPAEVISLDDHRMKRRLKRAREWAEMLAACMYCGDEFLMGDRDNHHCLRHPSQR